MRNIILLLLTVITIFPSTFYPKNAEPSGQISQQERSTIANLPWSRYEVNEVSDLLGGDSYFGNEASERLFKKNAHRYEIIHLATHAIVNDEQPSFSKLIFGSNTEQNEDGILYAYELYNLKLNAKLAVLSSCKTGSGKLVHGEGIFSIARAFMYAGVPSIIMSLWDIDDRSSAEIIVDFYKSMTNGESKTDALRNAKLEYLKNADQLTANPVYWAGLISVGNQESIERKSSNILLLIFGVGLILITGFIIYKKFLQRI